MDICGEYYCSRCMLRLETDDSGVCPHCGYDHARPVRSTDQLEEGTMLAERYQLGAVLGCGGFGVTYAAWDETLQVPVAVKEFFPRDIATRDIRTSCDILTDEKHKPEYNLGLRRFIEESRVLAMFHNVPGVVNVSDCFEENGTFYIVMEYVHGVTLDVWVHEHKPDAKTLLNMFRGPIDALDAIHRQGVQHRDIKPGNMLVEKDGAIKLIDFGSARKQTHRAKSIVLTEKYAPVEQYDLKQQQGPWTDVYSLCATMYEMLTGAELQTSISRQHHDELKSPAALGVRLKPYQQRALMNGLAVEPGRRIRSMDALRSLMYNLPLPEEMLRRKAFRRRLAAAAACTALVAAGASFNFMHGFALGGNVRYALYPDGFHLIANDNVTGELAIPASYALIPVSAVHDDGLRGSGVTSLTIPGSVCAIGDMAFNGCESLQTVTIEEGVLSIGAYAFANCPNLHTVILPDSMAAIDAHAFDGAWSRMMLWGSRGSAAEQFADAHGLAFASESDYTYEIVSPDAYRDTPPVTFDALEASLGDHGMAAAQWTDASPDELPVGVHITGYRGSDTDVVMPSYIGGVPVTHIASDDMANFFRDDMTSVVLPEHLITLPKGLLTDKPALACISLGGGLRVIEDYAFRNTRAEVIELPRGVQSIGSYAFERVPVQELVLPDTLATISSHAFSGSRITSVTVPESVNCFGSYVFSDCTALTSAALPDSMTVLPEGTFQGCKVLANVHLPDCLEEIGPQCFSGCQALERLMLPDGVVTIQAYAFEKCTHLKIIGISGQVESIAPTCFDGCPNSMTIYGAADSQAQSIADTFGYRYTAAPTQTEDQYEVHDGAVTLKSNQSTEEVTLPSYDDNNQAIHTYAQGDTSGYKSLTMPIELTSIGEGALAQSETLEEVDVRSVEYIKRAAFIFSPNLHDIPFPDNLLEIESFAFAGCVNLESVSLPASLESLGEYAFFDCAKITEIAIPPQLIVLPDGCFAQTGLTEITVPDNITLCGAAFFNCTGLTKVTFESGAEAGHGIGTLHSTFYGCMNLTEVTLPASLKFISPSTFRGCTSLTDVWIYSRELHFDEIYSTQIYKHIVYIDTGSDDKDVPFVSEDDTASTHRAVKLIYLENGMLELSSPLILESSEDNIGHLFADCPDVTVHGYRDTDIETYCLNHGIRFVSID